MAGLLDYLSSLKYQPTATGNGLMDMGAQMVASGGPSRFPQGIMGTLGQGIMGFNQGYDQQQNMDMKQQALDTDAAQTAQMAAYRDQLSKNAQLIASAAKFKGLADFSTGAMTKVEQSGAKTDEEKNQVLQQYQDANRPYLTSLGIPEGAYIPDIGMTAGTTPLQTQALATQGKVAEQAALAPGLQALHQANSAFDMNNDVTKDQLINRQNDSILSPEDKKTAGEIFAKSGGVTLPALGLGKNAAQVKQEIMHNGYEYDRNNGISSDGIIQSGQNIKNQATTVREYSPAGVSGRQVVRFNTAIGHLNTLNTLVDNLDNSRLPAFNKIANIYKTQTGQTVVNTFDGVKDVIAAEVLASIVPGAGGEREREALADKIRSSNNTAQLKDLTSKFMELMASKLEANRVAYSAGSGRDDFNKFLSPETIKQMSGGQASTGQQETKNIGGVNYVKINGVWHTGAN